jgi:hypothetical protein
VAKMLMIQANTRTGCDDCMLACVHARPFGARGCGGAWAPRYSRGTSMPKRFRRA